MKYLSSGDSVRRNDRMGSYKITALRGTGASCAVYQAEYCDTDQIPEPHILKEYCPSGLHLTRMQDGSLCCPEEEEARFAEGKDRFRAAGEKQIRLRKKTALTNQTPPLQDIFTANHTVYQDISLYHGDTLDRLQNVPLLIRLKLCCSAARLVSALHREGCLCLDLKPENIFVLKNENDRIVTDMLELIDFDSICEIRDAAMGKTQGCSPDWAAPEQKIPFMEVSGQADIYALGELVFFTIFGRHSVKEEHRGFSSYPFDQTELANRQTVKRMLTDFFRGTLRTSVQSRFPSMDDAVIRLEHICEELQKKVLLMTSCVSAPLHVFGRERELAETERLLSEQHRLFLCGIGGIGKSTLARKFCRMKQEDYDEILFLQYEKTLAETIASDAQVSVSAVTRTANEEPRDYFERKLRILKEITKNKRILFVLDNFNQPQINELACIFSEPWDILITTRIRPPQGSYPILELGVMTDGLPQMFEEFLRRPVLPEEEADVQKIFRAVHGHTLAVELIARQISVSHLSVREAAVLTETSGISSLAKEKVEYMQNNFEYYQSIGGILSVLFENSALTAQKQCILKFLSMLSVPGIEEKEAADLLGLSTKDDFYQLDREGWIHAGTSLSMHPVIAEAVHLWSWKDAVCSRFLEVIKNLTARLRPQYPNPEDAARWGFSGLLDPEANDELHQRQLYQTLLTAEALFDGCAEDCPVRKSAEFGTFGFLTVMRLPYFKEEEILRYGRILLHCGEILTPVQTMVLYHKLITVCADGDRPDQCQTLLVQMESALRKQPFSAYLSALLCDAKAAYEDAVLAGAYDGDTRENRRHRKRLISVLKKEAGLYEKLSYPGAEILCLESLLSLTNVLIRSCGGRNRPSFTVNAVFRRAEKLRQSVSRVPESLQLESLLTSAWFYTIVRCDEQRVLAVSAKAMQLADRIYPADFDKIDHCYIPLANIALENGREQDAEQLLKTAAALCDLPENRELTAYRRKKKNLLEDLIDIYELSDASEKIKNIQIILDSIEKEENIN